MLICKFKDIIQKHQNDYLKKKYFKPMSVLIHFRLITLTENK